MEVPRDHSGMNEAGPEGCGVLTTWSRSLPESVSHPQNGKVVSDAVNETGSPKKGSTWGSIAVDDVDGKTILNDDADADAVIPGIAVDKVNAEGRPTMGSSRAGKAWRAVNNSATVGLSIKDRVSSSFADAGTVVTDVAGIRASTRSDRRSLYRLDSAPTPMRSELDRVDCGDRPISSPLELGDENFPPLRSESVGGVYGKDTKAIRCGIRSVSGSCRYGEEVNGSNSGGTEVILPKRVLESSLSVGDSGLPTATIQNWKSLFAGRPTACNQLAFSGPSIVDGKKIIQPPAAAVLEGVEFWEGSLVGQFFDKGLPLHVVRSIVDRLWGKHELPEISTTEGMYIFRFRDPKARDWVLENGPWNFAGRPIILRFWKPGMEMLNAQLTSIPIWVKFFNIPLEYWTATSLGCIASAVGFPLHLDSHTENHTRLSFARICIEVDGKCEFPRSVLLDMGNGKFSNIRIEYPWVPQNCSHCKSFGHSRLKCQVVKKMGLVHKGTGTNTGYVNGAGSTTGEGPDSVDNPIGEPITNSNKVSTDGIRKVNGAVSHTMTGNTFECLATCGDISSYGSPSLPIVPNPTLDDAVDPLIGIGSTESSWPVLPSIADFSDSSPVFETFKNIKRIDELDSLTLPLSKKKLKKLKKQQHVAKSAISSSYANTSTPYITEID